MIELHLASMQFKNCSLKPIQIRLWLIRIGNHTVLKTIFLSKNFKIEEPNSQRFRAV